LLDVKSTKMTSQFKNLDLLYLLCCRECHSPIPRDYYDNSKLKLSIL